MINLKMALANDIREGIMAAQKAKKLPSLKGEVEVLVTHVNDDEKGNYASPVALSLAKVTKKPPMEIVEAIVAAMPKKEYVGKLEAAAPGFLNIRLNPGWMVARLDDVVQEDICADCAVGKGKLVNLEFVSANPTGPLTLANCRPAFTADTMANVLTCAGYNVTREYYINDAGAQVRRLGESVILRAAELQGHTVTFAQDLYQGEYIKEIARVIAERWLENEGRSFTADDLNNKELVDAVSQQAVELLLQDIKKAIEADLKIQFDVWTSERSLRQSGLIEDILERLRKSGDVYNKDGAAYLRTTKYGDEEDRIVVKKDKEYSYLAPDIAYHHHKFERGFDHILTFVGADHQGHAPKIKAAMQALGHDTSKLRFMITQFFRLVRKGVPVRLSKRAGQVFTAGDLIGEVGYDAARYFLLQQRLSSHLDFDLELALERSERNPVYYVQYAYVRLNSILRRAKEENVIKETGMALDLVSHAALTQTVELRLMRTLYRFTEVIQDIAANFEVHDLVYFSHDLAKAVHVFYKHSPVLNAGDETLQTSRLQLVLAAHTVLGKTLDLLGISKPDVM